MNTTPHHTTPHHTTPHRSHSWLAALFMMGAVLFSSLPTDVLGQTCAFCTGNRVSVGANFAPQSIMHVDSSARIGRSGNNSGELVFTTLAGTDFTIATPSGMTTQKYYLPVTYPTSSTDQLICNTSGQMSWAAAGTVSNAWLTTGNTGTIAGTNFLGTTDGVDLVLKTTGNERMRVMAGGNVGIGNITSPASLLHVLDQVRVGLTSGANGSLVFNNSAGNTITFNTPSSMSNQSYTLPTSVGTINQVLALTGVSGSVGTLGWVDGGGSTTAWELAGNSYATSTSKLGTLSNEPLMIYANNLERMRVITNGNVGIGTQLPDGILHVDNGSSNTDLVIEKDNATNGSIIFHNDGSAVASIVNNSTEQLILNNATSDQDILMNINDGGTTRTLVTLEADDAQVGINRTSPSAGIDVEALAVTGTDETVGRFTVTDASDNDRIAIENITTTNAKFAGRISGLSEETDKPSLTIRAYAWNDAGTQPVMEFQARSVSTIATRPIYKWSGHNTTYMTMIPVPGDSLKAYLGIGTVAPKNRVDIEGGLAVGASYSGTNTAPTDGAIIQANVGIGTASPGYKLDVQGTGSSTVHINTNGNIQANGTVYTSDEMFKNQIETIENALSLIDQFTPRNYFYDTLNFNGEGKFSFGSEKQYGFIAQEVEQILPELVHRSIKPAFIDSLGNVVVDSYQYRALNYTALIPILTKGIQELRFEDAGIQQEVVNLQNQVYQLTLINNELQEQMQELMLVVNACCGQADPSVRLGDFEDDDSEVKQTQVALSDKKFVVLEQNIPNPFAERTTINYIVPRNATDSRILFHDASGRQIQSIAIETGKGSIDVFASDLSSGTYTYTLVVDGKVTETKKMTKTN